MEGPRAASGTAPAREPPFDLAFRVDSQDHWAFLRATRARPVEQLAALLPVLTIIAVAALVGLAVILSSGAAGAAVAIAGITAVVLYLVNRFGLRPAYDRSVFTGQPMALGETKLVVDNRGVASNMGDIVLAMPWPSIARVVETDDHVFLMFARLAAIIVPKRAFASADQARRFAAFARQMAPGRR